MANLFDRLPWLDRTGQGISLESSVKNLPNFKIADVPLHAILMAATSEPDYGMDRTMIAEDWPDYGQYTVIAGSHCSCYGFEDTAWDATVYTLDELNKVISGWINSYGSEKRIAVLWLMDHH